MLKKKLLTLTLAVLICVTMLPFAAFAATDDDDIKVKSVSVSPSEVSLLIGGTRQLKGRVSPSNADNDTLSWESDDSSVVEVDDDGYITAVGTGTARVKAYAANGKSSSCAVTVGTARQLADARGESSTSSDEKTSSTPSFFTPGTSTSSESSQSSPLSFFNPKSDTTQSTSATTSTLLGASQSTQEIATAVDTAIKNAASGTAASVVLNAQIVSSATLQNAATIAKTANKTTVLKFTTSNGSGGLQGQLNITASNAAEIKNDINTAVYTQGQTVDSVREKFTSFFGKPVVAIQCGQQGSYGVSTDIYAKVNLGQMDPQKLTFHTYDIATNSYLPMKNVSYAMDSTTGFLRVTTNTGGYILVS